MRIVRSEGAQHVIGVPGDGRLIGRRGASLPDDEERHVATRDIRPGIDVICIIDSPLQRLIERVPGKDDIATLLRYKITIRNARVKAALEALSRTWKMGDEAAITLCASH